MTRRGKIGIMGIYTLLFLVFSLLSMKYGKYTEDYLSGTSARYEKEAITPGEIDGALESRKEAGEEVLELTLWNRLKKEKAENSLTGLQTETNVIEVYGTMTQVIPMKFLYGGAVLKEDVHMCVLDSVTAWNLFGTVNAVGNQIIQNEETYTVKGIIKAEDMVMIIPEADTKHKFFNLEADYLEKGMKSTESQGQQLKNFLRNNNLPEPDTVIDGSFQSYILSGFYHLALWILAGQLLYLLVSAALLFKNNKALCFLAGLTAILAVPFLAWLTQFQIRLPEEFIPGKWSDFDFYALKYKEWKGAILAINHNTILPKDKIRSYYSGRCMFYGILSAGMLIPVQLWLVRFFRL